MGAITSKHPRRTLSLLFVIAIFALSACSSSSEPEPDSTDKAASPAASAKPSSDEEASGGANSVVMKLIAFKPANLEVASGTEVTWTQTDAGFHTVTSGTVAQAGGGVNRSPDGKFSSERLATDKTFSFKFDEPGSYPYYCDIHPATMRGEVTVKG